MTQETKNTQRHLRSASMLKNLDDLSTTCQSDHNRAHRAESLTDMDGHTYDQFPPGALRHSNHSNVHDANPIRISVGSHEGISIWHHGHLGPDDNLQQSTTASSSHSVLSTCSMFPQQRHG